MEQDSDTNPMAWDVKTNEYECDCPGPPPPEFVLPPPPAPPSTGFCQDNSLSEMEYCNVQVLEGSYTQAAIPSIAVIVVCSVLMLVMLLVATFLLWKHKKKMQNFLPCKTSPQNHCDLSGGNSVLYEDLTNIRPRTLPNHCRPEQTITPIEVGPRSQLKLLDVKCSNYGGAGFTPMGNTVFIYPTKDTDTLKSKGSREHFNPAYEEVSAGSEEKHGENSQDSDIESEEPPSVASEDEFAEDELSLVDFPKKGYGREGGGSHAGSGTSSLRGSTGDDLCKDLDSIASDHDNDPHRHHHHHHRRSRDEAKDMNVAPSTYDPHVDGRTVERNRHDTLRSKPNTYYDKEVLLPQEAELIEQLRRGATGVSLGPQELSLNSLPMVGFHGVHNTHHHPELYSGVTYTPGVYGAGELGPKDASRAPPVYIGGVRRGPSSPGGPHTICRSSELGQGGGGDLVLGGGARLLNPGLLPGAVRLPGPFLSELNQKLNVAPPPPAKNLMVVTQNGAVGSGGSSSGGSNRNSRSSTGSGGDPRAPGRNSDPHERTLTEFSTFRPRKGSAGRSEHLDSGFASAATTTLPSRRSDKTSTTPEAQKLLEEPNEVAPVGDNYANSAAVRGSRRPKPPEKIVPKDDALYSSRTIIT